ncbi:hypothetical protein B0H19DRAFT_1143989 [Mycena capillaripes]|nr:hypothetical protein B0H19DRAFT_1143989 [Mycena capillaripes]
MDAFPDVRLSYGPMLIGVFFNMILYGVFVGQALTYYQLYHKDGAWMRYFVLYLFVLETLNTGFDMAMMYQPLILDYGQKLDYFPKVFPTEPLIVVLVSTPIQIFFAWRIYTITKMISVPAVIAVFAIAALAGGLWTTAKVTIIKEFQYKPLLHPSALLWFLASCVADILITISLTLTLSHRKTGFVATDSVIDKIIRTTIQTGLVTSVFSVLDVICFMVFPHYAVNFVWDLALSKLYSNALLSTLNARAHLDAISTSRPSGAARLPVVRSGGAQTHTGLGLVFEDMALVDGATPATTKFDEVELERAVARGDGDGASVNASTTEDSQITETPREGTGFMLYSGGSPATRGLEP